MTKRAWLEASLLACNLFAVAVAASQRIWWLFGASACGSYACACDLITELRTQGGNEGSDKET